MAVDRVAIVVVFAAVLDDNGGVDMSVMATIVDSVAVCCFMVG